MKRSDSGPNLRPFTLAFRDPVQEASYIKYHFETSLVPARWSILAGLVFLLAFGYLDYRIFPMYYRLIWLGRGTCAAYIALGFVFSYTPHYRWLMQPITAFGSVLCSILAIWMISVTHEHPFCGHLYVGIVVCVIFACMFLRLRFPWAAGSSLVMVVLFLTLARRYIHPDEVFLINAVYLSLATLSSVFGAYSIEINLRNNFWARLRYQTLLHAILPESIATRLNKGEHIIADDKQVSVLFADIVGSVQLATRLGSASRLVDLLNQIFSDFDGLVERRGLETIKTIGDGYMVTGNCSRPLAYHARAIADLALDLRNAIRRYPDPDGRPLSLRIGIHTGPVVAGVMKLRRPSYDLWGDTVNVASRMESSAAPGTIQITKDAVDEIGDDYLLDGPISIPVKGKGDMLVYHLQGRRAAEP
jgi:class 3 adenylate cyclase